MKYCFDLDGTICTLTQKNKYTDAIPLDGMIDKVNELYNQGNEIIIFTARGAESGIDWTALTVHQLEKWGLRYHKLIMNKKPSFDIFIDDKAINAEIWRQQNLNIKTGIIAGAFDVIHPGYVKMFKEAKKICSHLTIALHEDPTLEKSEKLKPILTLEERKEILSSIKYIDNIIPYKTEEDLKQILAINKFNVRILGEDYKYSSINSPNLTDSISYIDRSHKWSTTEYKKRIYMNYKEKYESINNGS